MMLPSGAVGNMQVVTGINTTAKIYLLMSENVSLAGTGGVTLYECGQYVVTGGVSGYSHAPLTSPSCSGLSGSVSTTLSLLDNACGRGRNGLVCAGYIVGTVWLVGGDPVLVVPCHWTATRFCGMAFVGVAKELVLAVLSPGNSRANRFPQSRWALVL